MTQQSARKVSTDALETLGQFIDETQKRDAIHLAVEPVVAAERLLPGDRITIRERKAYRAAIGEALGIVDPFLTEYVEPGQWFWFVMLPRLVHSLRHVWSHPAFPDEATVEPGRLGSKEHSEAWLRAFCERSDCPAYEALLPLALANDDPSCLLIHGHDAHGEIPPEFWDHVAIVSGRDDFVRADFFGCSC